MSSANADSRYRVATNNEQAQMAIDVAALESAVCETLRFEQIAEAEISLAIVNGVRMRELNNRFLQHDYDTDVLSFLLDSAGAGAQRSIEGEIIVSIDMAIRQAREHQQTVPDELELYVVHGTLHLCGYDDQTEAEASVMRDLESKVLRARR